MGECNNYVLVPPPAPPLVARRAPVQVARLEVLGGPGLVDGAILRLKVSQLPVYTESTPLVARWWWARCAVGAALVCRRPVLVFCRPAFGCEVDLSWCFVGRPSSDGLKNTMDKESK